MHPDGSILRGSQSPKTNGRQEGTLKEDVPGQEVQARAHCRAQYCETVAVVTTVGAASRKRLYTLLRGTPAGTVLHVHYSSVPACGRWPKGLRKVETVVE